MRICHLNTYEQTGGAARAAFRLHQELLRKSVDSRFFVYRGKEPAERTVVYRPSGGWHLWPKLRRWATRTAVGPFTSRFDSVEDQQVVGQLPGADLYNLHWLTEFLSPQSLVDLTRPLIWTLHDGNALTGGCHYPGECERYRSGCYDCPRLTSWRPWDLARLTWQSKLAAFARLDLHLVTPSRWLANLARQSPLVAHLPVQAIPNGVDVTVFQPRPSGEFRDSLGVDGPMVLFLGGKEPQKGYDELKKALVGLNPLSLVTVGQPVGFETLALGWIENDRLLALVYGAADLLMVPSREDNLPNTVLEAMACGTPAVAFDVGGIPEMVRPGKTGWLVPSGRPDLFREAVLSALADPARLVEMGRACRQAVLEEFTLEIQADRYHRLYRSVLSRSR